MFKHAIEKLSSGETVQMRPRGNSMKGKIDSGQLVTIEPVDGATLQEGDIVLVHVSGHDYLHLIKAIDGDRLQIGNNRGGINGWASRSKVYGKVTKVEP